MGRITESLEVKRITERILENSIPEPNTGCIFWLGRTDINGYGVTSYEGKDSGVHRIIYKENINYYITSKQLVHHKCRQILCVNLDHLELLTATDHAKLHGQDDKNWGRSLVLT